MHINFERSGGFAGMRIAATIDAETLPPSEARKMRELVEAADFFNLPSVVAAENAGPDRFQYKVTVKTEGRSHTVETHETGAPPSMRPLLDWLTAEARKEKK